MKSIPRVALILQTTYPVLILLFAALEYPSANAEAQRYPGPPYYLPFAALLIVVCALQFFAGFLLWIRSTVGWLLCLFVNGGLATFLTYLAISLRVGRAPISISIYTILFGIAALFAFLTVLLVSRPSFTFFVPADLEQKRFELSLTKTGISQ